MSFFRPDAPARAIVNLFTDDAAGWTADGFNARHKSGITVWIANEAYGLTVTIPGHGTTYGFTFPWGNASQIAIYRAFRRWQRSSASSAITAALKGGAA